MAVWRRLPCRCRPSPSGQSPEDKFREYLSRPREGPTLHRPTSRDLVRYVFARHNHFDADQLLDDLKAAGLRVSRATVYRTLTRSSSMRAYCGGWSWGRGCSTNTITATRNTESISATASRCGGRIIEFESPALEATMREVCASHQFQSVGHTLVVRGVCSGVQSRPWCETASRFDLNWNHETHGERR